MHKDRLPDVDAFLEELTALCRKHKMELWAPEKYGGMQIILTDPRTLGTYEYTVCGNLLNSTDIRVLNVHAISWGTQEC